MSDIKRKSSSEMTANMMIIATVVAGTIVFALINHGSRESELMSKLFLAFMGALITAQLIPGLVLLAAMIREGAGSGRKRGTAAEARVECSARK